MGKIRTFRDDEILEPLLDAIPGNRKRSKIIRRALYDYFFKGENKVMIEDEENYIGGIGQDIKIEDIKIEDGVKDKVKDEPVKEIKFDMFE